MPLTTDTSTRSAKLTHVLIDAIRAFPSERNVEHCGARWSVSPLDFYAICPACGARLKLRSSPHARNSRTYFGAVLEWMNQPGVEAIIRKRREEIRADDD